MLNGYGPAMQVFTKFSKIKFSILWEKGFLSVVYIDHSYLKDDDYEDCFSNCFSKHKKKFLDLLDSQSTQTNPNSYQHNASPI